MGGGRGRGQRVGTGDRTGQDRTGQDRTGQGDWTGHGGRTGQDRGERRAASHEPASGTCRCTAAARRVTPTLAMVSGVSRSPAVSSAPCSADRCATWVAGCAVRAPVARSAASGRGGWALETWWVGRGAGDEKALLSAWGWGAGGATQTPRLPHRLPTRPLRPTCHQLVCPHAHARQVSQVVCRTMAHLRAGGAGQGQAGEAMGRWQRRARAGRAGRRGGGSQPGSFSPPSAGRTGT